VAWLYVGYFAVFHYVAIVGLRGAIRDKVPYWVLLPSVVGGICMSILMVAFVSSTLTAFLGRASIVLLVITVADEAHSAYIAWRTHVPPRGMPPRLHFWSKVMAVAAMVVFLAPAYWMAFVVVRRVWLAGAP
jgi:hypothetical protein